MATQPIPGTERGKRLAGGFAVAGAVAIVLSYFVLFAPWTAAPLLGLLLRVAGLLLLGFAAFYFWAAWRQSNQGSGRPPGGEYRGK